MEVFEKCFHLVKPRDNLGRLPYIGIQGSIRPSPLTTRKRACGRKQRMENTIARRPNLAPPTRDTGPRVNHFIRCPKVRVIDHDGENRGVMNPGDAVKLAEEVGLDLVEVSPNVDPPVCKILDYGKFKYETQKKAAEARKTQKTVDLKEVKFRPNIDTHDYDVKLRSARKFLTEGDKLKVTLRYRGREMAHQELGRALLERVSGDLEDIGKVEAMPKLEGRQMIMVVGPKA